MYVVTRAHSVVYFSVASLRKISVEMSIISAAKPKVSLQNRSQNQVSQPGSTRTTNKRKAASTESTAHRRVVYFFPRVSHSLLPKVQHENGRSLFARATVREQRRGIQVQDNRLGSNKANNAALGHYSRGDFGSGLAKCHRDIPRDCRCSPVRLIDWNPECWELRVVHETAADAVDQF